ncbi:unnamed protein product [Adineta steineri]|uniref:Alpha-type protein kinase domain-containing protein n=1 Tax=Adineta steineri TaxID=433720 RepID=A0A814JPT3_9BILA|nr:unnamed protein product [Adineta steineri]CAF3759607.1 unnamed protein product [Adineta steineri]
MAEKYPQITHTTKPSSDDIDDLQRMLDELKRNERKNNRENICLNELRKQINVLQEESSDKLAATEEELFHARKDLDYVSKRTKEINEVIKALNKAESVDLCFLMDCTNSMKKYIEEVKNRIFETVQSLKSRFSHLNIRLAFVGYRDLNLPADEQFSILDFTNEKEFHSFVSMVKCANGGDRCEDVLGGLQKITNLNWEQSVRILIHIGDAPSHGERYHDMGRRKDSYFTHDSDGSHGYSIIQELIELQVKYFFGRLTSYTDKMIDQFCNYTDKKMTIEQVQLEDFTNLLPFIVRTVTQSISYTSALLLKNPLNDNQSLKTRTCRYVTFDEDEPIWSSITEKTLNVIKYTCNKQLRCEEVKQRWDIKIAENPFAEGAMRLAYYGLSRYKGTWEKVVLKEFKHIGPGLNLKERYLDLLDCQTVAAYLAQKFNELPPIKTSTVLVKKIKFIMTKLVFDNLNGGKYRNLTIEKFIEGSYKKFSNNAGYVNYNDPALTLEAYSHWTYEYTKGEMIVVDLQGIDMGDNESYLLTDPCIHSTDIMQFGCSNLGKAGMKRFFQTHICNVICLALKLNKHKDQPEIRSTKYDSYFVNKPNHTVST